MYPFFLWSFTDIKPDRAIETKVLRYDCALRKVKAGPQSPHHIILTLLSQIKY